jgi:hypothetical protein
MTIWVFGTILDPNKKSSYMMLPAGNRKLLVKIRIVNAAVQPVKEFLSPLNHSS